MYEDNHDPIDVAEQLARLGRRAAAEAFRAIACDDGIDPEYRINAAEQLARIYPRAAV